MMNKFVHFLKPFMPILAAIYGLALIYVTALPMAEGNATFDHHVMSWLLTLAAIALTYTLVHRVEPKVFPEAKHFSLKKPSLTVAIGLLLSAPLWCVVEGYIVYGFTSIISTV